MSNNKRILFIILAFSITALLFTAGCAVTSGQMKKEVSSEKGPPADTALVISDIRSVEEDEGVNITLEANQPLSYSMFRLENPIRLALDLPGADLGEFGKNIPVNRGPVSFIKPIPFDKDQQAGGLISRLEIFLSEPADYQVDGDGTLLTIFISGETVEEMVEEEEEIISSAPAMIEVVEAKAPGPEEPTDEAVEEAAEAVEVSPEEEAAEAPEEMEAEIKQATTVKMVDVVTSSKGTQVIIEGNGSMEHDSFLVESRSLVVDIYSVMNNVSPLSRKVSDEYIKQIRIGQHFEPRKKVRVVMDLAKPADYKMVAVDNKILVNFGDLTRETDETLRYALSNVVTDVYFRPMKERSILEIVTSTEPEFEMVESEDPSRVIIEVKDSRISPEAQKTLDLATLNREVSKIVSFQYKKEDTPIVRVVAQLREELPYRIDTAGNRILVDIPHKAKAVETLVAEAPEEAAPMEEEAVPAAEPMVAPAEPALALEEEAEEPEGQQPVAEPVKKAYVGRRLSLDFREAEIGDVLRLIADVSGINFVSGTEVKGKVTIKLTDVPWDQALDVILKSNTPQLTQIQEAENIIRITTMENIRREENERQRMEKAKVEVAKTKKELQPLVTKSIHISYAKVSDIESKVASFMSERKNTDAFMQSDDRTNTLIIRDLKTNVEEIEKVVRQLDTPTPAVQIEARIVTVNSSYSKDLGIQWGFNYMADTAHGNPTSLEFPNSVSLGGSAGAEGEGLLVNLPAAAPTSGIGLTLGHIANTLTLDLRLSAMEELGQVEILSNPKVFVVQNEEAIINVGRQLPIPKTDAEGNRTVEFKDVGIMLKVVPQVTADKRIFMEVEVERSDKGEDVKTTEGEQFSIDTQRAQTKVLLNDGETSVIGGLFQQTKSNSKSGVPGLSKIPGVGWLFRSKSVKDSRQELLIFLTPKIVQPI